MSTLPRLSFSWAKSPRSPVYSAVEKEDGYESDLPCSPDRPCCRRSPQPYRRKSRRGLMLYGALTALCVSGFTTAGWLYWKSQQPHFYDSKLPRILTSFKDEMSRASEADLTAMWDEFVPGGDGFIEVENPDQYGLPQGMTTKLSNGVYNVYGLSWTHQFHCLNILRHSFMDIIKNSTDADISHVGHCFDYLRQSILCHGDQTVEWPAPLANPEDKTVLPHIDGYGPVHQCVDKGALVRHVRENMPLVLKKKYGQGKSVHAQGHHHSGK